MPKYVVSSTLEDPKWNNSTVLKGDVVTEASKPALVLLTVQLVERTIALRVLRICG
jgi:hypothetical protein